MVLQLSDAGGLVQRPFRTAPTLLGQVCLSQIRVELELELGIGGIGGSADVG
jgi:hypothetical protein